MDWVALIKGLVEVAGGIIEQAAVPFAEQDPKNEDAKRAVQAGKAIQRIAHGAGSDGGGFDLSKVLGALSAQKGK